MGFELLQITIREQVLIASGEWGRAAEAQCREPVCRCKCALREARGWWVRAVADVPPLTLLLCRAAPSTPPSICSLLWKEQGCRSLFRPVLQHICVLAHIYLQFPEALLHPLSLCLFFLPGNTPCSSCLSSSPSFLSSSPIPPWETLHCTWPSFQSGATFTDVSSFVLDYYLSGMEKGLPNK